MQRESWQVTLAATGTFLERKTESRWYQLNSRRVLGMSREVVEPRLPPSPMVCGGEKPLCCGCVGTVMPSVGS